MKGVEKIVRFVLAIVMSVFVLTGCDKAPVGFTAETESGRMFSEGEEYEQFYNYCPSVMVEGDKAHVWYCANETSGVVGDTISYRAGLKKNGRMFWDEKQIVLRATEGAWDSANVCDPSVIRGMFGYQGDTYTWLMAYLGCTTTDNSSNTFGFAVANAPEGPWIKIPDPLYDFYEQNPGYEYDGTNQFIWGIGQTSLVSVDKAGRVLVFFTGNSSTGQRVEQWDLSDMADPKQIWSAEVGNTGVVSRTNEPDTICNADFVYDGHRKNFYMLCDVHPFDDMQWPTNLPLATNLYAVPVDGADETAETFGEALTNARWTRIYSLDELDTGFARNSNTGFFRDPYGWLPQKEGMEIAYTGTPLGADWKVLYTYRIYRRALKINF